MQAFSDNVITHSTLHNLLLSLINYLSNIKKIEFFFLIYNVICKVMRWTCQKMFDLFFDLLPLYLIVHWAEHDNGLVYH